MAETLRVLSSENPTFSEDFSTFQSPNGKKKFHDRLNKLECII